MRLVMKVEVIENENVLVEFEGDWAKGRVEFESTEWGRAEEFIHNLLKDFFDEGR
ncbi:hypothetical protein [Thermococcus sp. 9N3]|uniref:hypothetical protein n=1 Tax=Thermococcus sp. 9N3 TaxID=163002 RepID=UPI0014316206|nr:hypothetical protein [Thermococcus sp. 9N3]